MFYPKLTVRKTFLPNLWARSDGMISYPYPNGPWVPGDIVCVNRKLVETRKHTPKFYFVIRHDPQKRSGRDYFVHRIIAMTFCDNPSPHHFYHVDHINGESTHNQSSNLRWVKRVLNQANRDFMCAYPRTFRGKPCWQAKVTMDNCTHRLGTFKTKQQAAQVSLDFRAKKFTEIYRSYITNETATTRACENLLGRQQPPPAVHKTVDS